MMNATNPLQLLALLTINFSFCGQLFPVSKNMRGEKPEYLSCCALATSYPGVCFKAVESVDTHQRLCISCFSQSSLYIHGLGLGLGFG